MHTDIHATDSFSIAPNWPERARALGRFVAFVLVASFLFTITLLLIALLLINPVGLPLHSIFAI